ncbi:MAG: hypothetical protein KF857_09525 [Fimbriimonadaceae bacterium]|nr:hypothetical protein [Fimbriimonadaceae bacterium]
MTTLLAAVLLSLPRPFVVAEWRKPDAQGRSCASCHSPDGIELSRYGFSRQDLLRRAAKHLDSADRQAVAEAVLAARPDDELALNPFFDRPMQPGDEVLRGKTPAERDAAFLKEVAATVPSLDGDAPTTIADARRVQRELLAVDLGRLKVGVPMNLLSEDVAHGAKHSTLAHWTPDVGMPAVERLFPLEDAYLANPSWQSLDALDRAVQRDWQPKTAIEQLSKAKFRSLLVYQHMLRTKEILSRAYLPEGNPFWEVAEFGRVFESADAKMLGLPPDVARDKSRGPTLAEQMRQLRAPWYWLAWTFDPELVKTRLGQQSQGSDYFTKELLDSGYPGHTAFMLARKMMGQPVTSRRPWEMRFSYLLVGRPLAETEPAAAEDKELFRRVVGNILCATALVLEDEVKRGGKVAYRESTLQQLQMARGYLRHAGRPEDALFDRVSKVVTAAKRWP